MPDYRSVLHVELNNALLMSLRRTLIVRTKLSVYNILALGFKIKFSVIVLKSSSLF